MSAAHTDHDNGIDTLHDNGLRKSKAAEELVRSHFRAWDLNGDGRISEDELRPILIACGLPEGDVSRIFAAADMNGDGVLDYDEFLDWVFHGASKVCLQDLNQKLDPSLAESTDMIAGAVNEPPVEQGATNDVSIEETMDGSAELLESDFPPALVSNLCRRFPSVEKKHILIALKQADGHGGKAVGILKKHGAEGGVLGEGLTPQAKNLLRRYPGATNEMVVVALAEAAGHGGRAASIIEERLTLKEANEN